MNYDYYVFIKHLEQAKIRVLIAIKLNKTTNTKRINLLVSLELH